MKGVGGILFVCVHGYVCVRVYECVCVFIGVCVCVCRHRVITALESMLSGVGGVTRLDFWTRCCMDQMVHYTPVWQSNCSLYTTYKHTRAHKHTHKLHTARAHAHTQTHSCSLSMSEQSVPIQEDWIPTIHTFAR